MKGRKYILTIAVIVCLIWAYAGCIDGSQKADVDLRGAAYAGAEACKSCHREASDNYLHNAHAHTSWNGEEALQKIDSVNADYLFAQHLKVVLERRDSSLFQVAYADGKEQVAQRTDIGFGSGEKAFSFGYWQGNFLYQLPLSYFQAIRGWVNSPGFPAQRPNFQRLIIRRCFECHSTYIAERIDQVQSISRERELDRNSLIYGIDCERCHGAAAEHINFHRAHPDERSAKYITRWSSLSRNQKLDACAVCHSGNDLETQRSTFAFQPGDTLSRFYYPEFGGGVTSTLDVHGKQAQLLAASACFQKSSTLECSSCHQPHAAKKPGLQMYSAQCTGCHKEVKHKDPTMAISNCIDCHMPKEESKLISFRLMGKEQAEPYLLRTHRIAVYPGIEKHINKPTEK